MLKTSADKQNTRDWMERRRAEHKPPPSQDEIRRIIGWDLISAEREQQARADIIAHARSGS